MEKAERNYEIHDKELLVIVMSFKVWHHHCHSFHFPVQVITDHNNLRYFMTTTKLNQRQVDWAEKLAQYDFQINYRPGKSGGKPDALSRRSGYAEGEGSKIRNPYYRRKSSCGRLTPYTRYRFKSSNQEQNYQFEVQTWPWE